MGARSYNDRLDTNDSWSVAMHPKREVNTYRFLFIDMDVPPFGPNELLID